MRPVVGNESPRAYAAVMAGLWIDLRLTLDRLDAAAADPDRLLAGEAALPSLQYDLHRAVELAAGLTPPDGTEVVHAELVSALAEARETTADVAAALAHGGPQAAAPHVWEWRGALFRVRFVRVRLERPRPARAAAERTLAPQPRTHPGVAATTLAVGSGLVLLTAFMGLWPLLAVTLAGTAAGAVLLRP